MVQRPVIWVGDSKKALMEFPKDVRVQIGYALSEAQLGRKADYAKPVSGLGPGVLEIVANHDTNTYRAVYAVKIGEDIYVLHAFKKKSKSGIATPKSQIDVVKARLKLLKLKLQRTD
ncbi:type II toxin-antitoxin system RelE/ParE family toxin [uncultured Maricaulis sp.]|uniref:type II toxin-antitoxin system RelE/ParE family toxin n=1 Tax=uncultured Maricaulis sp. TaxID=174710 RepID=UPI0030D8B6C2